MQPESVEASYCAFNWFPLFEATMTDSHRVPLVPLTRPGARGEVEVIGHAPAVADRTTLARPNLIVHFADALALDGVDRIREALHKSGRTDASTSIAVVLPAGEMNAAKHAGGILYLEQTADEWERVWGVTVRKRPATFVVTQTGKIAWEHEGAIDSSALAETLRRVLVAGRVTTRMLVTPAARPGHAAPNFLFPLATGHQMTLRKLAGRPVILVFWRSNAPLSLDAARAAAARPPDPVWNDAVVLAIADGESVSVAAKAAASGVPATIVPDPSRSISKAYGVHAWPTIVFLDSRGLVRDVRHGFSASDHAVSVNQTKGGYAS